MNCDFLRKIAYNRLLILEREYATLTAILNTNPIDASILKLEQQMVLKQINLLRSDLESPTD